MTHNNVVERNVAYAPSLTTDVGACKDTGHWTWEGIGMKTKLSLIGAFCILCCLPRTLHAEKAKVYPDPPDYPVEPKGNECFLTVVAVRYPGTDRFTMVVDFCSGPEHRAPLRVGVSLARQTNETKRIVYQGRIEGQPSRDILKSLARVNNIHYWDHLFLTNYSGNEPLSIESLEVRISSANNRFDPWSSVAIAGAPRTASREAAPLICTAASEIKLDTQTCRIQFMKRYLPSGCDWSKLPATVRALMLDLGKCGTSETDPAYALNPKFGYPAGCSETISWYDYEFGEPKSFYATFKDVTRWYRMSDYFNEQKRLYAWDKEKQRFQRETGDKLRSIDPKPGDDFFWDDSLPGGDGPANGDASGHVMKVVSTWRGEGDSKHFLYMDGSYPIRLKKYYARTMNAETTMGYCLGRVPEND